MITIGKRIAELRRKKGITQEEMADKLGVTAQAVSKWENDQSCPDISLLPKLAKMLDITVDELLTGGTPKETYVVPQEDRKNFDDLIIRVIVNSANGDKVRVNLPMPLLKMGIEMGMKMPQVNAHIPLDMIDFEQLLTLVEKGVMGKLVEVESADGDNVLITVE